MLESGGQPHPPTIMLRTFDEHFIRPRRSLDGLWRFHPDAGETPPEDAEGGLPISVPSCWEMLPGFESWRGRAWLVREVRLPRATALRLVFGGVSHTAEVFWNGQPVARHEDAYTPFEVLLPLQPAGRALLALRVDNTFGPHAGLHWSNDYYTYGGITRPVVIQEVPAVHLARLHATPVRTDGGWELDLKARVHGPAAGHRLRILLDGRDLTVLDPGPGAGGGDAWNAAARVPAGPVREWSPDSPHLHSLTCLLETPDGQAIDDLTDRIGFREIRVSGFGLLLNGRPLRLRGYNRHEDHAIFGCALPEAAMAHDLALLRDLGANFVRTAHYPNDRRFLDLCDETGMIVWEESHARQIKFDHPRAFEQSLASTREMLDWHHNHPSILIWGCLNECDTVSDAGVAFHEAVIRTIKEADPSRPVTYAGHHRKKDRALRLVDIVSHNLYTGWYEGTPAETRAVVDDFLAWIDSPESGGAGKPFLVSECGAGAIAGFRAPPRVHLTEDYQADVLAEAVRTYGGHPRITGVCLWQFADCRVCEEGRWWVHRPRNLNDKGTVTRERARKLAYETVREGFHLLARNPTP